MNIAKKLWTDQAGTVMSAEMVTLGTVAVLSSVVGVGVLSNAVNDELAEVAMEVRGFEQGVTVVHQSQATGGFGAASVAPLQTTPGLNPAQQAVLQQYQAARAANESRQQANRVQMRTNSDGSMVVNTAEGQFEIRRVD